MSFWHFDDFLTILETFIGLGYGVREWSLYGAVEELMYTWYMRPVIVLNLGEYWSNFRK